MKLQLVVVLVSALLTAVSFAWIGCGGGGDDDDDDDAMPDDDDATDDDADDDFTDDDTAPAFGLTDHQNEMCWDEIGLIDPFCYEQLTINDFPDPPYCGDCDDEISCAVWACFADFFDAWEYGKDCATWGDAIRDCREKYDPCWPTHPDYYFGNPDCA